MSCAPQVDPAGLTALAERGLSLRADGSPELPLVFVDLDTDAADEDVCRAAVVAARADSVLVGLSRNNLQPRFDRLAGALACTLATCDASSPAVCSLTADGVANARALIETNVGSAPRAAMTLVGLLRITSSSDTTAGLAAESLAYSMLLNSVEFNRWLGARRISPVSPADEPAVLLRRDGDQLHVQLNRAGRHNAFGVAVRDGLIDALDLVLRDETIRDVRLSGLGASFCSGGDLSEFGTSGDAALAHLVRLDRSVGARLQQCRERVRVIVHGACIGAGIELPAFAGHVTAHKGTFFALPELTMGLVPGAGGTVSITRRIGRWRTAYLALTGVRLDVSTALDWGLIDDCAAG